MIHSPDSAKQKWIQPELLSDDSDVAVPPTPRFRAVTMRKKGITDWFNELDDLKDAFVKSLATFKQAILKFGDKKAALSAATAALAKKKKECDTGKGQDLKKANSATCKAAMREFNKAAAFYRILVIAEQAKAVVETFISKGAKAVKAFVQGVGKYLLPHTLVIGAAAHLSVAGVSAEQFIDCNTHEIALVYQNSLAIGTDSVSVGVDVHVGFVFKNGKAEESVRLYGNSLNFCAAGGAEIDLFAGAGVIGGLCKEINLEDSAEHVKAEVTALPKKELSQTETTPVTIFGGLTASVGLKIPGVSIEANVIAMCGTVNGYTCDNSTKEFILRLLLGKGPYPVAMPFNFMAAALAITHWALTHEDREKNNKVFCSKVNTDVYNTGRTVGKEPAWVNKNKGACVAAAEKIKSAFNVIATVSKAAIPFGL